MATTESDIRNAVAILLNKYGSLSTSEVKQLLETVMPFDKDDQKQSNTRNEPLILQRIGNIVSHQNKDIEYYCNSLYQIDKSIKPAQWTLLTGLSSNQNIKPLCQQEINKRKEASRKFVTKKIDWEQITEKRTAVGMNGEEFAKRWETKRVMEFAPRDTDRIIHLSVEQGDGAGYDILSLNDNGSQRYIEVKTTESGVNTPFYMTENEKLFFESKVGENSAFIYRVYDFDFNTLKGEIQTISADELFLNYDFDPISYKVTKKP